MARLQALRVASLLVTLFGTISNTLLAIQVIAAWRSLKWEPESEWELSVDDWRLDGVKVVWALLAMYFASAATVCAVGLMGIIKSKPAYVRFYRDYSIADFSFCVFFTALATYGSFYTAARAGLCEELSHHAELLRSVVEMGLNLENCEQWLERAVLAILAVTFIVMVVRLHLLLAVSNYYSHLVRFYKAPLTGSHHSHSHPQSNTMQRIFVVPGPKPYSSGELVYTAVPLSSLPVDVQATAQEAWVSQPVPCSTTEPQHQMHRHHRRRSSRSVDNETGLIRLPIHADDGLLPPYSHDLETGVKA